MNPFGNVHAFSVVDLDSCDAFCTPIEFILIILRWWGGGWMFWGDSVVSTLAEIRSSKMILLKSSSCFQSSANRIQSFSPSFL